MSKQEVTVSSLAQSCGPAKQQCSFLRVLSCVLVYLAWEAALPGAWEALGASGLGQRDAWSCPVNAGLV